MTQTTPHNLLPVCKAFSGRDDALDNLQQLIRQHRVCQLNGPAGIGKSELGRAAAHALLNSGEYPQGVYHLSMDGAGRPASMLGELIFRLGFNETKGIKKSIGGRRMLIVWDQMDTLLADQPDHLAETLNGVLGELNSIHHLVISRHGIDNTPAMTLGPIDEAFSREVFIANLPQSVSARPADDDAALTGALALLQGNPLAIRIAAGWCTPPNWTEDLENALGKHEDKNGLSRMLAVAMANLGEESLRLLHLLHAFPGGASPETLHATFGADSGSAQAALEKVGLLKPNESRLLPPAVREQVAASLDNMRADTFYEQAAVFLHQMVRECRNQVDRGDVSTALRFMNREWINLRAAFSWALHRMESGGVDMDEDCELILDYCFVLFHLFTNKLMFSEGVRWMEVGKQAAEEVNLPHELALIRDYLGVLNVYLYHDEQGKAELEAALAAFRELGEAAGIASSGYHLGLLAYRSGELDAAQDYFEEVLPLLRASGNRPFAAQATTFLGQIHLSRGDGEQGYDTLTEAMELYNEQTISVDLRLNTLFGLSRAALLTDREEESLDRVREAISVAFGVSPRVATSILPNILQMAEVYLRFESGTHYPAFTDMMTTLVERLKGANPQPEIAKEWMMTCHLMGQMAELLTHMGALVATEPVDRTVLGPALTEEARGLDALSGGLMGVEAWVNSWLIGPAPTPTQ